MLWLPIFNVVELSHVVDRLVTARREARHLVVADLLHDLRIGVVSGPLLEAACSFMTMQAFAVVVRMIEMQGLFGAGHILGPRDASRGASL